MPQVSVTINGRQFRMACEDGEEAHLLRLAEDLDTRISRLRSRFGEIGDTRLTVMAALTISDELSEAKEQLQRLVNAAAERIETITRRLNETVSHTAMPMG
jgi:cell division protein ZapA